MVVVVASVGLGDDRMGEVKAGVRVRWSERDRERSGEG